MLRSIVLFEQVVIVVCISSTCHPIKGPVLLTGIVRRQGGTKPVENEAFVPEVLYQDKYYPICGHHFWNNNNGATTVCKVLGFSSGTLIITKAKYIVDAMPIGSCNSGEPLDKCTGGENHWGDFAALSNRCKKGVENVGIQVICTGKICISAYAYVYAYISS